MVDNNMPTQEQMSQMQEQMKQMQGAGQQQQAPPTFSNIDM